MMGSPDHASHLEHVWAAMDTRRCDTLIVFGVDALAQYGAFQYATGSRPGNKGSYALVQRGDMPRIVHVGGLPPGERERRMSAIIDAARGSVGMASGPLGIPSNDAQVIRHAFRDRWSGDLSGEIDVLRCVASAEDEADLSAIARSIERALRAAVPSIRLGDSERDVAARLQACLVLEGAVGSIVQVSTVEFHQPAPTDRRVENGDLLTVFAEAAGSSGQWVELGAVHLIGAVDASRRHAAAAVHGALGAGVAAATGGLDDVGARMVRIAGEIGPPAIGWGHTSGVDEGTVVLSAQSTRLEERMVLALHPSARLGDSAVAAANTVVVGMGALSDYPNEPRPVRVNP